MKRIGKALLSSVLLFGSLQTAWAEESEAVTEETEEVTEITEEETKSEETVEEEVIEETAEETEEVIPEETAEEEKEEAAEETTEVTEEAEQLDAGASEKAAALNAARTSFVSGLYVNMLNRKGSASEVNYYVSQLNGNMTGAKMVASFVESAEYQSKYPGDRKYVESMYKTVLERTATKGEVDAWMACLEVGQTYRAVLAGMINSDEFKKVCAAKGIEPGSYVSPKAVDRNLKATQFISRFYTKALGRQFDAAGIESWAQMVQKGMTGAQLAENFVESAEYQNKKLTGADFIRNMYEVILGRKAAEAEVNVWLEKVNGGQTRRAVMMGLVNSAEFTKLCQTYAISRGTYTSPYAVDQNFAVTTYVGRLYETCLNRKADGSGLENWTRDIISGQKTAAGVANGFFNSPELANRKLSNSAFVRAAYQAILNRVPSNEEVASWTAFMDKGVVKKDILNGFYTSSEFKAFCKKVGMTAYVDADIKDLVKGSSIVSEALRWVGVGIYRNGGSNPATGTDCSGFTQYIFAQFGIDLNRTAAAQAENGVRTNNPKPGDLVLWTSHAAIYIGDGRIVAAANPWQGIKISVVSQVYTPGAFLGYYHVDGVE